MKIYSTDPDIRMTATAVSWLRFGTFGYHRRVGGWVAKMTETLLSLIKH
jgi:hypothetical protein